MTTIIYTADGIIITRLIIILITIIRAIITDLGITEDTDRIITITDGVTEVGITDIITVITTDIGTDITTDIMTAIGATEDIIITGITITTITEIIMHTEIVTEPMPENAAAEPEIIQ